jgi:hypothetical protein
MASFKGDSYYESHCETTDHDPDYRDSDEDDAGPERVERTLSGRWVASYELEMMEVYTLLLSYGRLMMGSAFLQFADFNDFCTFVFKNTTP